MNGKKSDKLYALRLKREIFSQYIHEHDQYFAANNAKNIAGMFWKMFSILEEFTKWNVILNAGGSLIVIVLISIEH